MPRDIATAVRSEESRGAQGFNPLLQQGLGGASGEARALGIERGDDTVARLQAILDHVKDAIVTVDATGHIETVNATGLRLFGFTAAETAGIALSCLLPEIQRPAEPLTLCLERCSATVGDTHADLAAHQTWGAGKDGTRIAVEIAVSLAGPNRRGYIVCIRDCTQRRLAESALFLAGERAQITLHSIGDAVIATDAEGRIEYMNPVAESLTGWESREALSRPVADVLRVVDETTRQPTDGPLMRCLREGCVLAPAEHTLALREGHAITIQGSTAPLRDRRRHSIGAVMVFHDISRERRLRRALHHQASHDALTGVINRREFENRLTAAVEDAHGGAHCGHVLLYLDLDHFKVVNDTCGHAAGDLLLKQLTGELQSRIRANDTLARLGGDEFGILLQNCTLNQAVHAADALRRAVRDYQLAWQDSVLGVGVSIGIVKITEDTPNVAAAMSAADAACYAAKDEGRNLVQVYRPGDAPGRRRELHWIAEFERARQEDRFELFFQPIVPILCTGGTGGHREHFELMLRLRDESGALLAPAEFIPAAERHDVMPAIDRWVVTRALDQWVCRGDDGHEPYRIAVNLSGSSLNDERFLEFLIGELHGRRLPAGAICFEVTEAAAISNLSNAVYFMREMKTHGCQFALDDFGSGLSSLACLKSLPVDYLKIDGRFIADAVRDPVDCSLVEAIGRIARALDIRTIAERVESAELLLELGRLGIGFAQGFHIAEPRPASEFPYRHL